MTKSARRRAGQASAGEMLANALIFHYTGLRRLPSIMGAYFEAFRRFTRRNALCKARAIWGVGRRGNAPDRQRSDAVAPLDAKRPFLLQRINRIGGIENVRDHRLYRAQAGHAILIEGLSKLEYRGYDSAGVAVYDGKELDDPQEERPPVRAGVRPRRERRRGECSA